MVVVVVIEETPGNLDNIQKSDSAEAGALRNCKVASHWEGRGGLVVQGT